MKMDHELDTFNQDSRAKNIKPSKGFRGFTLIEMLVAVVIVGVLAATALTNYQRVVREAKRMDAKAALQDAAQRLQRCYSLYGRYDAGPCGVRELLQGPDGWLTEDGGVYRLRLVAVSSAQFNVQAEAVAATQLRDTACITLSLNHTGEVSPNHCW